MSDTSGDILIDSKGYFIEDPKRVIEETEAPFVQSFQLGGQRSSESLAERDTRTFRFSGGAQRDIIPADADKDPREFRLFRWATAHTLDFAAGAVLPVLEEDSDETGLEVIRASAEAFGELWGAWEDASSDKFVARSFDGGTLAWGGGGDIKDNTGVSGIIAGGPMRLYKARLVAVYGVYNDDDLHHAYSSDGVSWTEGNIHLSVFDFSPVQNQDLDFALLEEIGGELVVAYAGSDGTIALASTADVTGAWATESPSIPSGSGPVGLAVLGGPDGLDKLLVGTSEGVWSVDTSESTWVVERKVFALPSNSNNCRRMTVMNNALFVAQGVSDNEAAPIYRISATDTGWVVESGWGLDVLDSIPTEAFGPVRWMKAVQDTLFVAVGGGAANRNAYILALKQNREGEWGWHTAARNSTGDEKIEWIETSTADDGVPRLHYAKRTGTSTSDTKSKAYISTPISTGLQKYESSGYIDVPEFNGGLPNVDAAFLRMDVDAKDLSADSTGEYIEADYGLDGDARTTNDLGASGSDLDKFFSGNKTRFVGDTTGSDESGVSGKSFAARLTLNRDGGDNTQTPILRSVTMNYEKVPETIKDYRIRIDLDRTAQVQNRSVEDVLGDLETARDSVTLVTFDYGELGTRYVRIRPFRHTVELQVKGSSGGRGASNTKVKRGGVIEVVLSEKI